MTICILLLFRRIIEWASAQVPPTPFYLGGDCGERERREREREREERKGWMDGGFWERLESFGAFAGWQTAALKAHRKPLLWPGPGVPVGEVALALGCLLGKVGLQPLQARKRQL